MDLSQSSGNSLETGAIESNSDPNTVDDSQVDQNKISERTTDMGDDIISKKSVDTGIAQEISMDDQDSESMGKSHLAIHNHKIFYHAARNPSLDITARLLRDSFVYFLIWGSMDDLFYGTTPSSVTWKEFIV